jgi:acyl-CoA thioesterase
VDETAGGLAAGFDEDTRLTPDGPDRWRGKVAEGWDVGGVPNGGYLLALVGRAMLAASGREEPVTVNATYLARARPGDVGMTSEVLRSGRGRDHVAVALHQDDELVVQAVGMTADTSEAQAQTGWDGGPPDLPPPDACVPMRPAEPPALLPPPLMGKVDLRLPMAELGFGVGEPHGRPSVSGWARFPDGRPLDALSLLLFADAFPPAIFNAGLPLGWVPSLSLEVQVRKRPAKGWLRCVFRTRFLTGDYLEEDGEIWDEDGDLVALSRQLALAPRPPRA